MNDYIFLMHNDAPPTDASDADWEPYLAKLRASGAFSGGSAIGTGASFRKSGTPAPVTMHLGGYLVIQAPSLDAAKTLLTGNPTLEAGGTVEIRELPWTD